MFGYTFISVREEKTEQRHFCPFQLAFTHWRLEGSSNIMLRLFCDGALYEEE